MSEKMSIELVRHSDGDIRLIVADGRVKQYFRCVGLAGALCRVIRSLACSSFFASIGVGNE